MKSNKFHIVYSKSCPSSNYDYNEFSTSAFILPHTDTINNIKITHKDEVLTFKLNDLPLTNIFFETWEKNYFLSRRTIHWNVYRKVDGPYRVYLQQCVNKTVDEINDASTFLIDKCSEIISKAIDVSNVKLIDKNVKLEASLNDIQSDKLNDIHFFFESQANDWVKIMDYNWTETRSKHTELEHLFDDFFHNARVRYYALETLNQLVHLLESSNSDIKQIFNVIRNVQCLEKDNYYSLQDKDYESFKPTDHSTSNQGKLYLDYATIGKDLFAAYCTNDIDLVKNNEVKPQLYCMPYVNFAFSNKIQKRSESERNKDEYKQYMLWCEKNKLSKYIDYTLPKHKSGRAVLGETSDIKSIDEFNDFILKYPYITGAYVE